MSEFTDYYLVFTSAPAALIDGLALARRGAIVFDSALPEGRAEWVPVLLDPKQNGNVLTAYGPTIRVRVDETGWGWQLRTWTPEETVYTFFDDDFSRRDRFPSGFARVPPRRPTAPEQAMFAKLLGRSWQDLEAVLRPGKFGEFARLIGARWLDAVDQQRFDPAGAIPASGPATISDRDLPQ